MRNQEFCFGRIAFKLPVSHLSGDVEWAFEYAHLELWREAKAGEGHFRITSKSPVKFSREAHCCEQCQHPGDGCPERASPQRPGIGIPFGETSAVLAIHGRPGVRGFKTPVGVCLFVFVLRRVSS